MRNSILVLALAISFVKIASAETIVLGEYAGASQLNVRVVQASGSTSSYVNDCKMAYNLAYTTQSINIEFGAVQCRQGLDTWNEAPVYLSVVGGQLLHEEKPVGTIQADGTAVFTVESYQSKSVQIVHSDFNCNPSTFETKNFIVGDSITYRIKKVSDNAYQLTRSSNSLGVESIFKKEWNNCPSIIDAGATSRESNFSVSLSK